MQGCRAAPVDGVHGHVLWDACQEAGDADLDGALRAVSQHAPNHNVANVLHKINQKIFMRQVFLPLPDLNLF